MSVTVIEHITLDGVMQAPGLPDEDTRGGFRPGGRAMPNVDETVAAAWAHGIARATAVTPGSAAADRGARQESADGTDRAAQGDAAGWVHRQTAMRLTRAGRPSSEKRSQRKNCDECRDRNR